MHSLTYASNYTYIYTWIFGLFISSPFTMIPWKPWIEEKCNQPSSWSYKKGTPS